MAKDMRYDFLVRLSDFYVKKIKNHLEDFNSARELSNINNINSIIIFWLVILTCSTLFLQGRLLANISKVILVLCPIFIVILVIHSHMLAGKYAKKSIYIHGNGGASIDGVKRSIRRYIMSNFVKVFGDFSWGVNNISTDKQFALTSLTYLKNLNILNVFNINIDDCISGKYKDVSINIIEPFSSGFGSRFLSMLAIMFSIPFNICLMLIIVVLLLLFIILSAILIAAKSVPAFIFVVIFLYFPCMFIISFLLISIFLRKFILHKILSRKFRGLLVEIDMNKDFEGHTFIIERANLKKNGIDVDSSKYDIVNLEDVEFEQDYVVYTQNQIEARYVITSAFMERFKNIKKTFNAGYIRASFKDKKIVLAIHTGRDMFNIDMSKDINEKTFVQLFEEIYSILQLVDTLKLNDKLGL